MLNKKLKYMREGQTLYNFLYWLNRKLPGSKKISIKENLVDPFYIENKELNKYYEEYLKDMNKQYKDLKGRKSNLKFNF